VRAVPAGHPGHDPPKLRPFHSPDGEEPHHERVHAQMMPGSLKAVLIRPRGMRERGSLHLRSACAAKVVFAESRHLRIESAPRERLPAVVESTAYILVARVSDSGRTTVEAVRAGGLLVVDAAVEGHVADLGHVADRVRTLVGSLEVTHQGSGRTLVRLLLPVDAS